MNVCLRKLDHPEKAPTRDFAHRAQLKTRAEKNVSEGDITLTQYFGPSAGNLPCQHQFQPAGTPLRQLQPEPDIFPKLELARAIYRLATTVFLGPASLQHHQHLCPSKSQARFLLRESHFGVTLLHEPQVPLVWVRR